MTLAVTSPAFKQNARAALADPQLQTAMSAAGGFVERRRAAADRLPEFDALRDSARDIKNHTLAHLDLYLEAYERHRHDSARATVLAQHRDRHLP